MPRFIDHTNFAEKFVTYLPVPESAKTRAGEFWNLLEVNSDRVLDEATDPTVVEQLLSPLKTGGLQTLCVWMGLEPFQSGIDLKGCLADYLITNLASPGCQLVILLSHFLYRRREDAIETIARLLLPETQFDLVYSSNIDASSKRFCYTLLVFMSNPHQLRLLMLFEKAERSGYKRFALVPKTENKGQPLSDEIVQLAEERIATGADLSTLTVGTINDILEAYETRLGQQASLCYELYADEINAVTLIFIFRYLRESYIREVDEVVFASEAELIVLRFYDRIRLLDEHSSSGGGAKIATGIASELLQNKNIQYVEHNLLTDQADLEQLFDVLLNEADDRLRFQELYLDTAPVEEAPKLILRCDKSRSLSGSLAFLRQKNIDLLQDLNDIRNLGVTFITELADGKQKASVFKIFCKHAGSGKYFLPYSSPPIATSIRLSFETHLRERYNVRVIPGTG